MTTKDLKRHEKQYWHIKKFSVPLLPIIGLVVFSILSYLNAVYLISKIAETGLDNLELLYPVCAIWIFGAGIILSIGATAKGGYNKLKSTAGGDLICGLICGLIYGLINGLIGGLIYGLINSLIIGLIIGLICGLIAGLINGLIANGLIAGLDEEFG